FRDKSDSRLISASRSNRSLRDSPGRPPMSAFNRRRFLTDIGMGFPGVALAAMLHRDGFARADDLDATGWQPPDGPPHFTPQAKKGIGLFKSGAKSHLESFDPKPALNRYAGKKIAETPFADALKNKLTGNLRELVQDKPELHVRRTLYPLQVGYRKRGA